MEKIGYCFKAKSLDMLADIIRYMKYDLKIPAWQAGSTLTILCVCPLNKINQLNQDSDDNFGWGDEK